MLKGVPSLVPVVRTSKTTTRPVSRSYPRWRSMVTSDPKPAIDMGFSNVNTTAVNTNAVTPEDRTLSPIEGWVGGGQPLSHAFSWHSQSGVSTGVRFISDTVVHQPPSGAPRVSAVDSTFPSESRVTSHVCDL